MDIKKVLVSGAVSVILLGVSVVTTFAAGPALNECWGTVVSQRAVAYGDLGEHSSSFEEPRIGVGNLVFRIFDAQSVGSLGSLLGSLDGLDATNCP